MVMKTLNSTELRANLSSVMDRVNTDHEPVIVTRAEGSPVVMVSLEDWASMDETAYLLSSYLLSSPRNAARLADEGAWRRPGWGASLWAVSGGQGGAGAGRPLWP